MTEATLQAYLPTVATLTVLGIGLLFNNSRIGDVNNRIGDLNSNLNKRMDDLNNNLNKRMDDLRADSNRQFAELREQYSRMETVIVGKITELEVRLDRM